MAIRAPDGANNKYASYIYPDCDLVHLSAHIVAKKTGQTCLSLVLHMLMPEVFLETSFKRYFLILLLIYQVCGPYRAGKLYEQRCLSCLPQGRVSSSWTHSSREREVKVKIRQYCRLIIGKYFRQIYRYCVCQPIYRQKISAAQKRF